LYFTTDYFSNDNKGLIESRTYRYHCVTLPERKLKGFASSPRIISYGLNRLKRAVPYGYEFKNGRFVQKQKECSILLRYFDLIQKYEMISEIHNHILPSDRIPYKHSRIKDLLCKPFYSGYLLIDGEYYDHRDKIEAVITREFSDYITKLIKGNNGTESKRSHFYLNKLIANTTCNWFYTAYWGGLKKNIVYYRVKTDDYDHNLRDQILISGIEEFIKRTLNKTHIYNQIPNNQDLIFKIEKAIPKIINNLRNHELMIVSKSEFKTSDYEKHKLIVDLISELEAYKINGLFHLFLEYIFKDFHNIYKNSNFFIKSCLLKILFPKGVRYNPIDGSFSSALDFE